LGPHIDPQLALELLLGDATNKMNQFASSGPVSSDVDKVSPDNVFFGEPDQDQQKNYRCYQMQDYEPPSKEADTSVEENECFSSFDCANETAQPAGSELQRVGEQLIVPSLCSLTMQCHRPIRHVLPRRGASGGDLHPNEKTRTVECMCPTDHTHLCFHVVGKHELLCGWPSVGHRAQGSKVLCG
jgi:hypothetical protein